MKIKKGDVPHIDQFKKNREDIESLLSLKSQHDKHGLPRSSRVLYRAVLLLQITSWEYYIEGLARNAFNFLINNLQQPEDFPEGPRYIALQKIIGEKVLSGEKTDPKKVWAIAGDNWKAFMKSYADSILEDFSTPTTERVNKLFENTLGLKNISDSWKFQGVSAKFNQETLDQYVRMRGDIAHKMYSSRLVAERDVQKVFKILYYLAGTSSNAVRKHLKELTKIEPWVHLRWSK